MKRSAVLSILVSLGCIVLSRVGEGQNPPQAKVISHDVADKDYLQLLTGPPDSVTMRSGRVTLAPGKSIGRHSTGANEEILVILEGQGEMRISGGTTLNLTRSVVAYCPPNTEHDVYNTSSSVLRYVYVVAKAQ